MSSAHISVALSDGAGGREVAVFAVHVVSTGTRIVTQPDTEVLHGRRFLLVDLLTGNDFTVGLLDLRVKSRKNHIFNSYDNFINFSMKQKINEKLKLVLPSSNG